MDKISYILLFLNQTVQYNFMENKITGKNNEMIILINTFKIKNFELLMIKWLNYVPSQIFLFKNI